MSQKLPDARSILREKRLAEALRANLRRRKEQDRGRASYDEATSAEHSSQDGDAGPKGLP